MIKLNNVNISYGDNAVLENVMLSVKKGEKIAIMGKSGSGKTTLARLIAGLIKEKSGEVLLSTDKISYAFQEARLIPWLNCVENAVFPIGESEENYSKAKELLEELEIDDANKLPNELSGGMQQRVSIARALLYDADVVILDEPFSALDEILKVKVISLIKKHSKNSALIVITHDFDDAKALSDTVYFVEDKHLKLYA